MLSGMCVLKPGLRPRARIALQSCGNWPNLAGAAVDHRVGRALVREHEVRAVLDLRVQHRSTPAGSKPLAGVSLF